MPEDFTQLPSSNQPKYFPPQSNYIQESPPLPPQNLKQPTPPTVKGGHRLRNILLIVTFVVTGLIIAWFLLGSFVIGPEGNRFEICYSQNEEKNISLISRLENQQISKTEGLKEGNEIDLELLRCREDVVKTSKLPSFVTNKIDEFIFNNYLGAVNN